MTAKESNELRELAAQLTDLRTDVTDRLGRVETHVSYMRDRIEDLSAQQMHMQATTCKVTARVASIAATVSLLMSLLFMALRVHLV
jgi:TolA-binding protein